MSQFTNGNVKTFFASGAIPQFSRVKLVAGLLAVAAAADADIGIAEIAAFASGDAIPVRLRTAAGTYKCIASAAIAQGAEVYADANGEVGVTNTNPAFGTALDAVSGAGSIVEVLRF
ncbi:MAG TPA: capsid cement protein [Thermomicrobiales bacterium]|nr:capsid cement protein [Thermomicrobiales bacterium]